MSADLEYFVSVNYGSTGRIDSGLGAAKSNTDSWLRDAMGRVGGLAAGINSAFDSAASAAIGTIGALGMTGGALLAATMGTAVKEGLDFNSFVESKVLGLAGTLAMVGKVPINEGLERAKDSVEELRKAAAVLPGEFKDVLNFRAAITPVGTDNGVSDGRLNSLSARGVAASAALGIPQQVAARELAAILEGRAKSSMPLATKMGIHATEFNKLSSADRFAKIEESFSRLDPLLEKYASSWEGLTSTIRDNARHMAGVLSAPLFEDLKTQMGAALNWWNAGGEESATRFATALGGKISYAFNYGLMEIEHWGPIALQFGENISAALSAAFGKVSPYLDKLAAITEGFMKDPKAFDKIVHVAETLIALRVGTGAVEKGAGLIGTGASIVGGIGTTGLAELGAAIGPAAIALAAFGVAAYGATDILLDKNAKGHDLAVDSVEKSGKNALEAGLIWGKVASDLKPIADLVGLAGLKLVEGWTDQLVSLGKLTVGLEGAADWINRKFDLSGLLGLHGAGKDWLPTGQHVPFGPHLDAERITGARDGDDDDKIKAPKQNVTNHYHMTVEVKSEQDPNRIAIAASDVMMAQLQRMNERARNNPMASLYRR